MQRKKKQKKPQISADDTLRAFITVHVLEEGGDGLSSGDRAALVDSIIEVFGDSITGIVKGGIALLTTDEDDDDDDDDDEDEEDDEEDEEDDE